MKRLAEKAKENPLATIIISLLLGGGGTGALNYDYVMDILNTPKQVRRMEARQILLMRELVDSGRFNDNPVALLNLMYPSQEVVDSILEGQR